MRDTFNATLTDISLHLRWHRPRTSAGAPYWSRSLLTVIEDWIQIHLVRLATSVYTSLCSGTPELDVASVDVVVAIVLRVVKAP